MPSDFRMLCQEGQDFETHIEVEWTEPCLVVRATNVNEAGPSTTVEREYCVPEHPSLALGLILLAAFARRSSGSARRPRWPTSSLAPRS